MREYFMDNEISSRNTYLVRVSEKGLKTKKVHLSDEK